MNSIAAAASVPAPAAAPITGKRFPSLPIDSLAREVYCVLGLPLDIVDMDEALARIDAAVGARTRFLISTVNLNFLIGSLKDPDFRETVMLSDMCTVDGTPLLWIARLLGVPAKERVAGSDMLERLTTRTSGQPLSVFLLGGADDVAAAAGRALGSKRGGARCAGALNPGFGSIDDLSRKPIIDAINAGGADFLAVALGAGKGQAWLRRNHDRLDVPVRVHLGAAIGFLAGTIARAPRILQKLGLEWLWRIKEEPQLWARYWADGRALMPLLLTRVLPLVAQAWRDRRQAALGRWPLDVKVSSASDCITVSISGDATAENIENATPQMRRALALAAEKPRVLLDLSGTRAIDARFLGLLLMMRKCAVEQGASFGVIGVSSAIAKVLRLHEATFLLSEKDAPIAGRQREAV